MSENIHMLCTNDGCAQITMGCITLTYTCVVHTKTYPKVLCACSHTIREHVAYDHRAENGTTANEKVFGYFTSIWYTACSGVGRNMY